ncbi:MAG: phosphoglycerate kinase [Candidatus Woesearchaeota archaeon]
MFRTMDDMDFKGKKVVARVDFNVPLDDDGGITDDSRIRKALPTIKRILEKGAEQLVLMSHLGRPKGEAVEKLKMDNVAERLSELLGEDVKKMDDCVSLKLPSPEESRAIMLENLRFRKAEKDDDEGFAKALAEHGDVYVNDAFGTCHRKHASVHAITRFIPACAGLLVEKEIKMMGDAINNPERPLIAILGFAKISDKTELMENLLKRVDKALIGGGIVFTFLRSQGFETGKSLVEEESIKDAKRILEEYEDRIILPTDIIAAESKEDDAEARTVGISNIPENMIGLDIGPETVDFFRKELDKAGTVIWNGPLGVFEIEKFAKGSREVAEALAKTRAKTIIGGGDTASMIKSFGLEEKMTHVSTGGGASLEFLSGKELPAIKALEENAESFS